MDLSIFQQTLSFLVLWCENVNNCNTLQLEQILANNAFYFWNPKIASSSLSTEIYLQAEGWFYAVSLYLYYSWWHLLFKKSVPNKKLEGCHKNLEFWKLTGKVEKWNDKFVSLVKSKKIVEPFCFLKFGKTVEQKPIISRLQGFSNLRVLWYLFLFLWLGWRPVSFSFAPG